MNIREELETGWPSNLTICQRVAAYGRVDRVAGFKVGFTCNPSRRAAIYRYNNPEYDEMVVIYRTTSETHIRSVEREMIAWFRDDYECDNDAMGGGPIGAAPYYLYVVLRRSQR